MCGGNPHPHNFITLTKAVQAIDVLLNVQRTVCRTGEHVAIRLSEETAAMMDG